MWARVHGLIRSGTATCPACGVPLRSCRSLLAPRLRARRNMRAPRPTPPRRAIRCRASAIRSTTGAGLRQSSGYSFADYAALPDRQSRLAGRDHDAPLGREGHAPGRESGDGPCLLRDTSRDSATAMPGSPMPMRRADGWPRRSLQRARPGPPPTLATATNSRSGRAMAAASRAPTTTAASMLCCSPRTPTTRQRFLACRAPSGGRLRRPDRDADRAADADTLYRAAIGSVTTDAGLMMDRPAICAPRAMRTPRSSSPRGRTISVYRPADPERFYDMLLLLASDAAQ